MVYKNFSRNSLVVPSRRTRLKDLFSSLFVLLLCVFSSHALALEYPEPDPPKLELRVPSAAEPQHIPPSAAPTTEWIYHKSNDGVHPDGNEQQFMWLMNRARSNPTQEGIWLATMDDPDVVSARTSFEVNLGLLQSEFAALDAKPPAAFDVRLYNAAKSHSDYLISVDRQDHDGQFNRITAAGFRFLSARGNVFSYSKTAVYGHAGFNIDWGPGDGTGMQPGRGHRLAIMSVDGAYTNVGIAAVPESDPGTAVGPLVVTGNFCSANTGYADHYNLFIVGTVWEDQDEDGLYDPGEGMGNITVMPSQGTYYAVTGESGGYAIPLVSGGSYQVSFTGTGVPGGTVQEVVNVGTESVLLDLQVDLIHQGTSITPAIMLLLGE